MPLVKIKNCLNCGVPHEWLFDSLKLSELRDIQKLTGFNLRSFTEAADNCDAEAIAALLYVLHKRDKIGVSFDDVDVDFSDFSQEPTEDELAAMKAAGLLDEDPKDNSESGQSAKAD